MPEGFSSNKSLRIEWKLQNILSPQILESRTFCIGGSRCKFQFQSRDIGNNTQFVMYLESEYSNKSPSNTFSVDTFVEDKNREPQFRSKVSSIPVNYAVWSSYASFFRRKGLSPTDSVTFVCTLTVESSSKDEKDVSTQTDPNVSLECLLLDFQRLLDDNILSDVTFKCGDLSIPAHRNVLSARSKVFHAMLRSDMAESRKGIIEISDMEPSTLCQLVQYIYSSKVSDLSLDSAQQLYAAADKYAIDSLRKLCYNFVKDNMTKENACNVLALADAHRNEAIKDFALSFLMETELLKDDDHWLEFLKDHPKLATEVIHYLYKRSQKSLIPLIFFRK